MTKATAYFYSLKGSRFFAPAAAALAGVLGAAASPAGAAPAAGVVSHVAVTSDKTQDVSSLEAWKASFIKPGMSDEQKALAVWESVVRFRHQEAPPNEYLGSDAHPHDPIKCFNVYGYGQCCCASANVEALARYAGLRARGWGIIAHSVPEIYYANAWHVLDASLITCFPRPDGSLAGVEDVAAGVSQWYAEHPGYKGNNDKLYKFMGNGGWKKGPDVLARGTGYDANGWLPAATHGWYSTMQEYADPKKTFPYEYGSAAGYEVNVQLRRGERLTRNWSNKGLHVNAAEGADVYTLKLSPSNAHDMLRYSPRHGDLAPGRIGNGTLEYDLPLADGGFRDGALQADNFAARAEAGAGPAARVKDPIRPAVLVVRMPTPYVYLSGTADVKAVVGEGGDIAVELSDNNGLDWKEVAHVSATGEQHLDLKPLVYRRYDYRLRFTLKGNGTGLDAMKIVHDVQHSQRALPALDKGENTITLDAGPREGTITIEGSANPDNKGKNLTLADYHPQITGMKPTLFLEGGAGEMTLPLATPGDVTRLRIGAHYRARDAKDGFDVRASFDGGKTFKTLDRLSGPTPGDSRYVVSADVPPGSRAALVRFAGQQRNTTGLFDVRVSADYAEPHGGFAPVKVTYVWEEAGVEKRDVHVARQPRETYPIRCAEKPALKSLIVERAD